MNPTKSPTENTARYRIRFGSSVLCFVLFATSTLAVSQTLNDDKARNSRAMQLSALTAGDEAFTEPIETIKVACAESGIVDLVKVQRGDRVSEGDLLFELDMSVLEASRRLAQAKASTKAKLKAAEAEFENKNKRFTKLAELLEDKAGSHEEVERAKTDAEIARQSIEAIIEENEQYALETKQIETQMDRRRIRTPINGVVIDVRKKSGEYVSSNDPHVATVVQLDTLRVVFYLPTARTLNIKQGDSAEILMTESDQHAKGIVQYVAPVTSADSGRVRVDVLIKNSLSEYRSGVRCRILEVFSQQSMMESATEKR